MGICRDICLFEDNNEVTDIIGRHTMQLFTNLVGLHTGSEMRWTWSRLPTLAVVLLVCLVLRMFIRLSTDHQPATMLYQMWFESLRHLSANTTRTDRQTGKDIEMVEYFLKYSTQLGDEYLTLIVQLS
ncbi:hypothetical protein MAR_014642 [Mya arenaria]|uniref:Uncharacterized protein n=1 Tax=Mya arenaria TaxID=6604 RepID=A0ABY7FEP4_MYAAR|nr:hypothetical protein MAR_014642 [Mya arenaria]